MDDVGTKQRLNADERATITIDVVSDVVCPWCFIGKRNLEAALSSMPDVQVGVRWLPYQLDPTIPAGGHGRQAYMARKFGDRAPGIYPRITDSAKVAGLDLAFDRIKRSPNTFDAHRLIRWAWAAGKQDAVVERLFAGFFVAGEDIGDHDVLVRHAEAAGMDGAIVRRLLAEDADSDAVRQEIDQARALGVTGVPFFIIGQKVGVAGAQPPEALVRAIRAAQQGLDTL